MTTYTVGEVSRMAGVSVRTLHHYDAIGLVRPTARSATGYRLYGDEDLTRLRRVLYYRELAFSLRDIAAMLAGPQSATEDRLRRQHRLLRERRDRDARLVEALEREMEARTMGISLTPAEQFELWGTDRLGAEYATESEERWGGTDTWRESRQRTLAYTIDDWRSVRDESDAVVAGLAAARAAGEPASGDAAMALAEAHRLHLSRWFYDCDHMAHRRLAELSVTDDRFRAHFDDGAPGLSDYIRDAICANSARGGAGPGPVSTD